MSGYRYRRVPVSNNDDDDDMGNEEYNEPEAVPSPPPSKGGWIGLFRASSEDEVEGKNKWWGGRETYHGALLFNLAAFTLPAVYETLSKLWIAKIDSSMVSTAETYTYIGVAVEVINEGLPRAAYKVVGDKSRRTFEKRVGISSAMILFQVCLGMLISVIICGAAKTFTDAFVPTDAGTKSPTYDRAESVKYVRIGAFSAFFSALNVAVSVSTRALDRPDVPLAISTARTAINIILDVLLISTHRVTSGTVHVTTQAVIRLCCDAAGALVGLLFYLHVAGHLPPRRSPPTATDSRKPDLGGLKLMAQPGSYTFAESAVRNALYMWLVAGIVSLGNDYGTAWAIFNSIRWGIVMVPVYSLDATSSTFVGHAWGRFKALNRPRASNKNLLEIARPAILSGMIALLVEVPLCLVMTFAAVHPFALYLSQDPAVADITAFMWRSIDWCYIFFAVTTMAATVLLATRPQWYLLQSLGSNLLWVLPWAIVVQVHGLESGSPWLWYALVFGGSMVFSAFTVTVVLVFWARKLKRGGKGSWWIVGG